MPKITLTADEEIQYLRELDKMQEMIPDLEIQIISQPQNYLGGYILSDSSMGNEFRTFLQGSSENSHSTTTTAILK